MKTFQGKIMPLTAFFICILAATVYLWYVTKEEQSTCNAQTANLSTYECPILQTLVPIELNFYAPLASVEMEIIRAAHQVYYLFHNELGTAAQGHSNPIALRYIVRNHSPHIIRAVRPVSIEGYFNGEWLGLPTLFFPQPTTPVIIGPNGRYTFSFVFRLQPDMQPEMFRAVKTIHYIADLADVPPYPPTHHLTAEFTLD